nr:MAG TPA: hypothetical protein [Caudoviricetes sp.]
MGLNAQTVDTLHCRLLSLLFFSVCLVCLSVHQKYSKRVQNTHTS